MADVLFLRLDAMVRLGGVWGFGRGRAAIGILISVVVLMLCVGPSALASESAAQRLVDAYAPIVMMRAQRDGVCDSSEEQYAPPTTVNVVLRNPRVRLLERVGKRMVKIDRSPGAADLAGLTDNFSGSHATFYLQALAMPTGLLLLPANEAAAAA